MFPERKKRARKHSKYSTSDGHVYLTKREMISRARIAGKAAAAQAMTTMGFVVVAENGKIVRKFADGHSEVIGTF